MRRESYHSVLAEQTVRALWDTQNVIDCVPDGIWNKQFGGHPMWQHIYQLLLGLDQWFISPRIGNLVDFPADSTPLSRRQLNDFFYTIKAKLSLYLSDLHDEDLLQCPHGCPWSRLTLLLTQYRHLNMRLGMIMGYVEVETKLRPRTLRMGESMPKGKYDPYC